MNCSDFNRFLDDYESLGKDELEKMNSHAQDCENCKSELEFFKSILQTTASLPIPEPPADFMDKVNSRIDALQKSTIRFDRVVNGFKRNAHRYAYVAACAAVGIIVGLNGRSISDMLDHNTDRFVPAADITDRADAEKESPDTVSELTETPRPADSGESADFTKPIRTDESVQNVSSQNRSKPDKMANAAGGRAVTTPAAASGTFAEIPAAESIPDVGTGSAGEAEPAAAAPTESALISRARPEPTQKATETSRFSKHRYTIAREGYHIPSDNADTATAAVEPSENPERMEIDETKSRYQIAMGGYEISEEEKKQLRNMLIVTGADAEAVNECIAESGMVSTQNGYEGTAGEFRLLISKLDGRGIHYNYAQAHDEGDTVSFVLVIN